MVAAFEQSLSSMTARLQQLTASTEQKDTELDRLRSTIENLKQQGITQQQHDNEKHSSNDNPKTAKTAQLIRRHTFNTTNTDGMRVTELTLELSFIIQFIFVRSQPVLFCLFIIYFSELQNLLKSY